MLFKASITIPANTSKNIPTIEILKIASGIITKIMVRPRPGHLALAHCVILHHEHQIAPSTEGMDLSGDTFPIDWEEYYESYQPAYELKIKGWNDDATYAHTFDIFIVILPRKAILALAIADVIKGLFGLLSPRRIFTGSR
ncbi:hypothetical protein LCGC14_0848620 [marine sediment metagenome]|uniref:Uncharacterized protein n=1 Tax=marine sediment metagenome TaxID=412755 RepID=A0A0F9RVS5_9ZZZZ